MIAVVTGADGFCGKAMSSFLVTQGVTVISVRRSDFHEPGDTSVFPVASRLVEMFSGLKIDYLFHFAGTSHTRDNNQLFAANVLSATSIFEALSLAQQIPVVVLSGSAAEYGQITPEALPLCESRPVNPADNYGLSKSIQTRIGLLASCAGHRVVMSRPFNIVGLGMPSRLALGNFLQQIAASRQRRHCILTTGSLSASRDFVHVRDAVRAWWELANKPAAIGHVINLCSGTPVRLQQMVDWLIAATPFPVSVNSQFDPNHTIDMPEHFGSIILLRSILGWAPEPITAGDIRELVEQTLIYHA